MVRTDCDFYFCVSSFETKVFMFYVQETLSNIVDVHTEIQ